MAPPTAGPGAEPFITLLTDYGHRDIYVGVLHGVIAQICPAARVIDVSHAVPPGNVFAGALALADALPYLPTAIHVAVVDPGVGGARRAVALACEDGSTLIGPDNGLLTLAARRVGGVRSAVDLSESRWRLPAESATFHGRDVFAPVAAELAGGRPLSAAGTPVDPGTLVALVLPQPRIHEEGITAMVTAIDGFGNLALYANPFEAAQAGLTLGEPISVAALPGRYASTFSDVHEGELLLHGDSTGRLALAVNGGSAAAHLIVGVGDTVTISR
jgi:S-adenosylmethionine hydrolase